jgi:hypothetical protein
MLGHSLNHLLELQADAELHESRIFQDGGSNAPLHAVAHLLLGLGGDADLDEPVVGVGDGLEEVGNGVGGDAVVLEAEGLEGGVLVHHGAESGHGKVVHLQREIKLNKSRCRKSLKFLM